METAEILKTIHIGDSIYLVNERGDVYGSEIKGINKDGFSFTFNNGSQSAKFENGKVYLEYKYNNAEWYYFFFSKQDAAIFKKEIVKKTMNELISKCENSWNELKKFRKEHFDILNSPDIDKWIKEFENNKNW